MEWIGVEIHPETPPEGMPMTQMFRPEVTRRMMKHVRTMAAPFGIAFTDISRISNSRLALQAAEFARENGAFDAFHTALFQAYFSSGLDIGDREVIMQIGRDISLNSETLGKALQEGTYLTKLQQAQEEASRLGVTGVPTFFFGDKKSIVGVQSLDVFRKALGAQ